jgi:hypothetical protein
MPKIYYGVLKLQQSMDIGVDGQIIQGKLPEGEYVIPVFDTREQAEEHTDNGRFEIFQLKLAKENSLCDSCEQSKDTCKGSIKPDGNCFEYTQPLYCG